MTSPTPSPSPSPPPSSGPCGREDRWRGGRGSDSEETPRSQQGVLTAGRERRSDRPESSSARREVRSMVCREEESAAFGELDDPEDPLDEEEEAPWEEPTHVTRKRARGRRAGKKVAARPPSPERVPGAYDDYHGLCLLCMQPGHRAADCTTGPVCLRCGEAGHMSRECSLPLPPRPASPPSDVMEPARKRVNDAGRGRRVDVGAGDHRARAPEARQAAS
nr:serine/arginine-rich splicing factor RS2Z32-like [Lolium perenne]